MTLVTKSKDGKNIVIVSAIAVCQKHKLTWTLNYYTTIKVIETGWCGSKFLCLKNLNIIADSSNKSFFNNLLLVNLFELRTRFFCFLLDRSDIWWCLQLLQLQGFKCSTSRDDALHTSFLIISDTTFDIDQKFFSLKKIHLKLENDVCKRSGREVEILPFWLCRRCKKRE